MLCTTRQRSSQECQLRMLRRNRGMNTGLTTKDSKTDLQFALPDCLLEGNNSMISIIIKAHNFMKGGGYNQSQVPPTVCPEETANKYCWISSMLAFKKNKSTKLAYQTRNTKCRCKHNNVLGVWEKRRHEGWGKLSRETFLFMRNKGKVPAVPKHLCLFK